jgi:hypothetical protein
MSLTKQEKAVFFRLLSKLVMPEKLRVCANRSCAKQFAPRRKDQRHCSEKCARLVANRKWWRANGREWRKGR